MATTELVGRDMAKRMGRPRKPTGVGSPVRLDKDLHMMAKNLSGYHGATIGDYLSGLLRPIITREYRTMVKAMDKAAGEGET